MKTGSGVWAAFLVILSVCGAQGWFISRRRKEVCYGDYGCFSNDAPFDSALFPLPQSPSDVGVTFLVHTMGGRTFTLAPGVVTGLRPGLPTKVIVHGYMDRATNGWVTRMATRLLEREAGRANVVAVDWRLGADSWNYYQALANTRLVGAVLARLLEQLEQAGSDPATFHLLGHSLGAHAVGYAGNIRGNVGRITGLDPAGPGFYHTHPDVRLDPSDAAYVDVIHTDDAETISQGLGMSLPMGTADFYPNGGSNQPGCGDTGNKLVQFLFNPQTAACSHMRVLSLFTESINQGGCSFQARQCNSTEELSAAACLPCTDQPCPVMGYDAQSSNATGILYLETNSSPPFCKSN